MARSTRGSHVRVDDARPQQRQSQYSRSQYKSSEQYVKAQAKRKRGKLRVVIPAVLLFLVLAAIAAAVAVTLYWTRDLPECDTAEDFNVSSPTQVYASDGTTLLASFSLQYRVPLTDLSDAGYSAKWATVAVEDERFYEHGAIDVVGIARALVNNITGGDLEGASTITQQLARNTVLSDEMSEISVKRKLREAAVAVKMEELFSKDEILLMYMNTVNYGSGAYGIEAAAQRYFSKSAKDLTLGEAALLAGIPQSPTYNNPIDYPDNAVSRRNAVLDRMVANGFVSSADAAAAKAEPLALDITDISTDGIEKYPYFASYVRDQLLDSYDLSTAEIFEGGLTVYTTLDPEIQQYAEAAVAEKLDAVGDTYECALTAIDPETGYIKAMVGGRDFYENQYNLAAQAKRSPGSSFKTFTLVAAIEDGISPQTNVSCSSYVKINDWEVKNYGSTDYGTRTIASAFAVSSNTAFARLIAAVGVDKVIDVANRMGITSDLDEVLGLTLGVSSVTTLEMADAYATIANGGTHYDAVCVTKVVDRKGNVVVDNTSPKGTRAISPSVAYAATQVMKGVVTSGTGTAARLSNGQDAAGKTGTSEYEYDSWFCGITPQLSVAIWLGDPDNETANRSTAASVFSSFMNEVLDGQDPVEFPTADEPTYTKKFNNTDLDVTISSSWSYSKDWDSEDDDDRTGRNSANNASNESDASSNTGSGVDSSGSATDWSGSSESSGSASDYGGGASGGASSQGGSGADGAADSGGMGAGE